MEEVEIWVACAHSFLQNVVDKNILVISSVYRPLYQVDLKIFWNELRQIKAMNIEVWVVTWDLNVTKSIVERKGKTCHRKNLEECA